ncbi:MFS transporter [Actinoplanes sp. NPDC051411]|uniref:MFS transporter n=1 Tax=Actinoplanes sp. NPDC051411 TaxID=3155522 RepID=UPI00344AC209
MFLAGAVILAAGSLLAAAAPDALLLVLARIVQGLGGAAVVACSLGLIGNAYPEGRERARATGIWGAALGAGVAIGPFLALGLQATAGWRSAYTLTAALAVALAACGRSVLAESRAVRTRPVDVLGAALLAFGLSALPAGLVEGRGGWARPATGSAAARRGVDRRVRGGGAPGTASDAGPFAVTAAGLHRRAGRRRGHRGSCRSLRTHRSSSSRAWPGPRWPERRRCWPGRV